MNRNVQGRTADQWKMLAANEEFHEAALELVEHLYVHSGWDPNAAWRARVKAVFTLQADDPAETLS
jgi:hypothetical protein